MLPNSMLLSCPSICIDKCGINIIWLLFLLLFPMLLFLFWAILQVKLWTSRLRDDSYFAIVVLRKQLFLTFKMFGNHCISHQLETSISWGTFCCWTSRKYEPSGKLEGKKYSKIKNFFRLVTFLHKDTSSITICKVFFLPLPIFVVKLGHFIFI